MFTIRLSRKAQTVVAGTKCGNGTISKNDQVRVIRGPKRDIVFDGESFILSATGNLGKGSMMVVNVDSR